MPRDATLHVKLQSELAQHLKRLAKSRGVSLSSLVRQAIAAAYQPDLLNLAQSQRHALEAYQGGYISIGRLAEAMGLHVLQTRDWLKEHGIPENTSFGERDSINA